MAIVFDSTDGDGVDYLENTSPLAKAVPLTFACWVNPDAGLTGDGYMSTGKSGPNQQFFSLHAIGAGNVVAQTSSSLGSGASTTSGSVSRGEWNHAAAVFASSASRIAYLNGIAATENTTNITPVGIDLLRIASHASSLSIFFPFDGLLAECAIWDVALTPEEIVQLALGFAPTSIRLASLVSYYPFVHDYTDWYGGNPVTPNNVVIYGDHPRVLELADATHRSAWGGF